MAFRTQRKRLLLQGAAGSIGRSVLDVVRRHNEHFRIVGIAGRHNSQELWSIASEFDVESVAIHYDAHQDISNISRDDTVRHVFIGPRALEEQASNTSYDLLINAVSGCAGLEPTAAALKRGISVALANKETLVAAGPIIMQLAHDNGAAILPIDSEHSAIYQCLIGEHSEWVRNIWLTTSGGPFCDLSKSELDNVTVEHALSHPTWRMGPKITVDSATLFNKGLEVIEAHRLFGIKPECIKVVLHRQSVVHSMVEYRDGSIKAQLSIPDMRLPILFALSYPDRCESDLVKTDVNHIRSLTFESVPFGKYPCLDVAFESIARGGTVPAAVSAADEVVVEAFLKKRIRFTDIAKILESVLESWPDESLKDIETVRSADIKARRLAQDTIVQLKPTP